MRSSCTITATSDENRLVRFFRCLPPEKQFQILYEIGNLAVEERLSDDDTVNSFARLMPIPPVPVAPRGGVYDDYTIDHLLYCAIEETGDPQRALLGSSLFDEDENIPRICFGAKREADRMSNYWFAVNPAFAERLLHDWRLAIVKACEDAKSNSEK